jgi:hypothetical protein
VIRERIEEDQVPQRGTAGLREQGKTQERTREEDSEKEGRSIAGGEVGVAGSSFQGRSAHPTIALKRGQGVRFARANRRSTQIVADFLDRGQKSKKELFLENPSVLQ